MLLFYVTNCLIFSIQINSYELSLDAIFMRLRFSKFVAHAKGRFHEEVHSFLYNWKWRKRGNSKEEKGEERGSRWLIILNAGRVDSRRVSRTRAALHVPCYWPRYPHRLGNACLSLWFALLSLSLLPSPSLSLFAFIVVFWLTWLLGRKYHGGAGKGEAKGHIWTIDHPSLSYGCWTPFRSCPRWYQC